MIYWFGHDLDIVYQDSNVAITQKMYSMIKEIWNDPRIVKYFNVKENHLVLKTMGTFYSLVSAKLSNYLPQIINGIEKLLHNEIKISHQIPNHVITFIFLIPYSLRVNPGIISNIIDIDNKTEFHINSNKPVDTLHHVMYTITFKNNNDMIVQDILKQYHTTCSRLNIFKTKISHYISDIHKHVIPANSQSQQHLINAIPHLVNNAGCFYQKDDEFTIILYDYNFMNYEYASSNIVPSIDDLYRNIQDTYHR